MAQVRLDDDLVADIDAVAAAEGWSRAATANRLIAEALDARDAPAPAPVAAAPRSSFASPVRSRRRSPWAR